MPEPAPATTKSLQQKEKYDSGSSFWILIRRWTFSVGRWMLIWRGQTNAQRPSQIMPITVTDYLDVVSSWCFWSEPTWADLRKRYEGRVQFQWKIALMDPSGLPTSREQEQWFYRRSGMMMRSPFMLNTNWYDPSLKEWLIPNAMAEAAKDFGVTDDRVRLAIANAALRDGKKVSDWNVAVEIGAAAANLDKTKLLTAAQSSAVKKRIRPVTAEFHTCQVTKRPASPIATEI